MTYKYVIGGSLTFPLFMLNMFLCVWPLEEKEKQT